MEAVGLLDDATAAVNRLGGVGLLLPNPHLVIGPHLRIEAVLSSRIEGTQTDVPQLLRLEADAAVPPEQAADAREVANYIVALEHGLARVRDGFPVSARLMREMHERLLRGVRGRHRRPGELRKSPVWIGGDTLNNAVFVPPPPDTMPEALRDLESFVHEQPMPLLVQVALVHYQFEAIHPFLDGNGRLGRILIPLLLVERGVLPEPLPYLSAYFEQNRSEYYDRLNAIRAQGDWEGWLKFFLTGVAITADDAVRTAAELSALTDAHRLAATERSLGRYGWPLLDLLAAQPIVTIKYATAALGSTPATVGRLLDALVSEGIVEEITGRRRDRVYRYSPFLDVLSDDPEPS